MIIERDDTQQQVWKARFEQLFKDYYSPLYYYALRYIPDPEISKDLVSDTFHFVWEHMDTFRMETAKSYLYTHIQRLCIDYLRRSDMIIGKTDDYLAMLREWNDSDWRESECRIRRIMELIEQMPVQTRTVMQQHYVFKKKYVEIAQMEGISESNVRKHIMKGLNLIRNDFSVKYKKGCD